MSRKSQLPDELIELAITALHDGHTIKLASIILRHVPTEAEIADEAELWIDH
jgi:RNA:NAD 2'-phosphotransferase (TPT1/KptA family)